MAVMSDVDFRTMNLNLLPALAALLDTRGVSAAASRVGVTQSAMSHSLARLRELLDDPLLVPAGRQMVPTPRGSTIAAELPEALEQLASVLRTPAPFDPATATTSFSLATLDYFELTALPEMLAYLGRHAPHVKLDVRRVDNDTPGALARGELDLALVGASAGFSGHGLRSADLFEVGFSVIARPDHPRIGRRLSLPLYTRLDHVLVSVEGRRDGVVDRALAKLGRSRNVVLRVPHFMSAPLAVLHSDAICTLATTVARRAQTLFGVRVFRPPLELPQVPAQLWWPKQHDDDPARAWLRGLFLDHAVFPPPRQRNATG